MLIKSEVDPYNPKRRITYYWYSPGEIYFERNQVIWLIAEALPLPEGEWVVEPSGSGYTEITQGSKSFKAPFETPAQVMGELRARLEMIPRDPKYALIDGIQNFYSDMRYIPWYWSLTRPAKDALNYLSSDWRRLTSFSQWRYDQDRKKRRKSAKGLTRTNTGNILRGTM